MVHVILGAALGCFCHGIRRLALGADEENAAALGNRVAHENERLVQRRDGLGQVHDVDAGTLAVDVRLHAWVPAVGLVTEVNASFEQLTHCEVR